MRTKLSGRPALCLLLLAGAIVAYSVTASAVGRALKGEFCTIDGSGLCMALTWDGIEYGTRNREILSLNPGTYWITVNDGVSFHNFSLRSCPGSTETCAPGTGTEQDITTLPFNGGEVRVKLHLEPGTYRLFCAAGGTGTTSHEIRGMFVDFNVDDGDEQ